MNNIIFRYCRICVVFLYAASIDCASLKGEQLFVLGDPGTTNGTSVFQMSGVLLSSFYSVSNFFAPPLARNNLTNILQAYFYSQNPSNFNLYASLFETSSLPVNTGKFGAIPSAMWYKGCYMLGNHIICDVRFAYLLSGSQKYSDDLITLISSNGAYYVTSDVEIPAICYFKQNRNHESIWNNSALTVGAFSPSNNFFAVTNYLTGEPTNPWVVWVPGREFQNFLINSNTQSAPTNMASPESVVAAGVRQLISNNQSEYLSLIYSNDLNRQSQYFQISASNAIRTNWDSSRSLVVNGIKLAQAAVFGDAAYVTYFPIATNGVSGKKDWLYLRLNQGKWWISSSYEDSDNMSIHFLNDSCAQQQPNTIKVLPGW